MVVMVALEALESRQNSVLSALGPNRVVRGESPHNLCKLKLGTKHKTNAAFFAGAVYWCICAFGWCFTCTDTALISLLLRPKERCQQVLSSHSLDYTCSMDRSAAPLTHAQYWRCLRRIMSGHISSCMQHSP